MSNSSFEAKPNTGALFANEQKQSGSRQPDYRGYLLVGDARVQLAGWKRKSKAGAAYVSIKADTAADEGADDGEEGANA
jgi:uncharacterized protein (DUF736 family)